MHARTSRATLGSNGATPQRFQTARHRSDSDRTGGRADADGGGGIYRPAAAAAAAGKRMVMMIYSPARADAGGRGTGGGGWMMMLMMIRRRRSGDQSYQLYIYIYYIYIYIYIYIEQYIDDRNISTIRIHRQKQNIDNSNTRRCCNKDITAGRSRSDSLSARCPQCNQSKYFNY